MAEENRSALVPAVPDRWAQKNPDAGAVAANSRGLQFHDVEGAWRFATIVVNSGEFKDIETPEQAVIRIQAGMELGLSPIWALSNIMVTNGRPSVWGDAFLGLIQASPEYEDHQEFFEVKGKRKELSDVTNDDLSDDATRAVCIFKRRGKTPKSASFSVADAKKAKLWGKVGKNNFPTPWVTFPKRMMQMRAREFSGRDAFSDLLRGLTMRETARDIPEEKPISATVLPPMQLPGETTQTETGGASNEGEPAPSGEASERVTQSKATPTARRRRRADAGSSAVDSEPATTEPEPSGAPASEKVADTGEEKNEQGEYVF